ncbi:MAG: hypothetical protein GY719_06475 [bacterium]|nr:hypothetical protein [bacterium]
MLVCRKGSSGSGREISGPERESAGRSSRVGEGGPVFLPRRKPSAITEAIMADAVDGDRVTAFDEIWYAGRPVV